jgi:copper chaperone
MTRSTYTVQGMTCDHCANSVRDELSRVDGVQDVHVDLPSGTVTVIGDPPPAAVHAAIEQAGYQLVA